MKITPDPEITTMMFNEEDNMHRVNVRGENVFEFSMSDRWHISVVSVTKDRKSLTITVDRREE